MTKGYGEILKKAREAKKLTFPELQKILKMDQSYLRALEDENVVPFEKHVYMRLFLKTYAKSLKVDVKQVLALYDFSPEVVESEKTIKDKPKTKDVIGEYIKENANAEHDVMKSIDLTIMTQKNMIVIGSAVAAIVILIVLIMIFGGKSKPGQNAGNNIYMATVTTPASLKVSVRAKEDVWMKARYEGGEEDFMLKRGEEKQWKNTNRIVFLVGNAGGVEFTVNNDAIGVIGESGEVINGLVFETGKNWYIDKSQGFKRENPKPAAENTAAAPAAAVTPAVQ
jgi:hypothetical protein